MAFSGSKYQDYALISFTLSLVFLITVYIPNYLCGKLCFCNWRCTLLSETISGNMQSFKNDKKNSYFILKALFVLIFLYSYILIFLYPYILVTLPHFLYDFWRKIFLCLYSINWPNFIFCLPLFLEITVNTCIVIAFVPVCYVINFKNYRCYQAFSYIFNQKNQEKNVNILRTKRALKIT